jgi:hypothetical protein
MAQISFHYHSWLTISYQGPICSQVRDPISQVTGLRNFPCRCLTASCLSEHGWKRGYVAGRCAQNLGDLGRLAHHMCVRWLLLSTRLDPQTLEIAGQPQLWGSKLLRPIPIWVVTQAARLPSNILDLTLSLYNSKSPRFLKLVWLVLESRPFFWLMSSTIAVRNSDKSH